MPTPIQRIQTQSPELNRVQDVVVPVINAVLANPILDGRLIELVTDAQGHEVPLTLNGAGSFQNIEHKLGRAYRGWWLVNVNGRARVWEDPAVPSAAANPDVTKYLRLQSDAAITLKLWVF